MPKPLRHGDSGPEVRAIQEELKKSWSPDLDTDGKFGPKTEKAVRDFQKSVGFEGKEVDGVVGSKTRLALFQTFDLKIIGNFIPKLKMPEILKNPPTFRPAGPTLKIQPALKAKDEDDDPPKRFQSSIQFGAQESKRDGPGGQLQLGLTVRTRDYWPSVSQHSFYHGAHLELLPSLAVGLPIPGESKIFTGQIAVTVQPLTDWLVIKKRWHLLTPSAGAFAQIPLNPRSVNPGEDDLATHKRAGVNLGLELFHFDIKEGLSIGVSGQESGYYDFQDRTFHWDPSIMGFIQGNIFNWGDIKSK